MYSLFARFLQIFKLKTSKTFSQKLILFDINGSVRILHVEDNSLSLKISITFESFVKHSIELFDRILD